MSRVIGEVHDNPHHHRNQARAVAALKPGAIVFEMLTPENDSMYGSLVTFRLPEEKASRFFKECDQLRMWTTKGNPLRLATHIHTRPSDLDLFFETAQRVLG